MRIISGLYGGRRLNTPKDDSIRPTSDKIRGSLFNILRGHDVIEGAKVLDLFCGTGALGLEALSQGAAHCTFVDKNRTSLDLARQNAQSLGAQESCHFILKDAAKLQGTSPASLVFMDPPYGKNMIVATLENLHAQNLLAPQAMLVVEEEKRWQPAIPEAYETLDERIYGETKILFLHYGKQL